MDDMLSEEWLEHDYFTEERFLRQHRRFWQTVSFMCFCKIRKRIPGRVRRVDKRTIDFDPILDSPVFQRAIGLTPEENDAIAFQPEHWERILECEGKTNGLFPKCAGCP